MSVFFLASGLFLGVVNLSKHLRGFGINLASEFCHRGIDLAFKRS